MFKERDDRMDELIYIWGTNAVAKYTYKNLLEKKYNVAGFIVSDEKNRLEDNIYTLNDIKNTLLNAKIIITARNNKNIFEIIQLLNDNGITRWGILKPRAFHYHLDICIDGDVEECDILWNDMGNLIPRIEINLIDNCNLKCKACTHFSSIFPDGCIYEMNSYVADIKQLRKIGRIARIRLLGGEPLLIDNIDEYAKITREVFPESDIEIVTNGLLIPQIEIQKLERIKEYKIGFVISAYQPTMKIKDIIEQRLTTAGVWWCFEGELIECFSRNMTLDKVHDSKQSARNCCSSGCTFFRNGKLYKCPQEGLINYLLSYYDMNVKLNVSEISVYEEVQSLYSMIKDLAMKEVQLCEYCSEEIELIPWQVLANPNLKDWMYEGNI